MKAGDIKTMTVDQIDDEQIQAMRRICAGYWARAER